MDFLKKIFPLSFNASTTKKFVINLLIYIIVPFVLGVVLGIVAGLVAAIPLVGTIVGLAVNILCNIIGLYSFVGLILLILVFAKVIK